MVAPDPFDWQSVYPEGLEREARWPHAPLWHLLWAAARERPEAAAIHAGGRTIAYRELRAMAASAAGRLGQGAGERVLLWMRNRPEFVAWFHGALRAGRVVAAASPHLTPAEVAAILDDAEPDAVVADEALLAHVPARAGMRILAAALAPGPDELPPPRDFDPHATTAVLQYTSGTTGGLKAAEMSHENLVANAWQNDAWFAWTKDDVVLGALPLCHTWGMGCVMNATLLAGASMALADPGDPAGALETIVRRGVTVVYGSATMFHRLLDVAGADAPRVFARVRYVKAGAMLVGGDLPRRWAASVPGVPMALGYGLTEASPEVTNNPLHARRAGTVGVPLPSTHVRLCVPEDPEREVPRGEEGEVQVRGPQVMRGYWRRPVETAAALLSARDEEDGSPCRHGEDHATGATARPPTTSNSQWLRTGDLGRFDEAGYLVIVDRLKDLIKFRGYSVAPAEVERALLEHPSVAEACVVGRPDARDGEAPVAFLRLRDGAALDEAALAAHLETRLARFKHPRAFRVVAEIPKNAVGKPLRRVLRGRASST